MRHAIVPVLPGGAPGESNTANGPRRSRYYSPGWLTQGNDVPVRSTTVVRLNPCGANQQIDLMHGIGVVCDNVGIRFEVSGVKESSPPIFGEMPFEIRPLGPVWAAARPVVQAFATIGVLEPAQLGRHCLHRFCSCLLV